ncbi:S41 family peptidase [Ruminococcus albus]|uniref:Peptidase S41 n=1 Tax=Ruminococcus albus (strain ATCC 27210 / DSM 20455 / JCM 14654 / NCDO 2250 / 7) TaxID=697329 RepID=E6UC27_RUMA7|nr:S41 family peptidase [Ruminococcus albus]ADU22649.1 peptidase S41 [Ruminococcus albus 7 = DSM 20455]
MSKLETLDIVTLVLLPLMSGGLWYMAGHADRVKNSKWRLLWLIPMASCFLIVYVAGVEKLLIPAYIGAVILGAGFFIPKIKTRRAASGLSWVLVLISLPLCLFNKAYRSVDYVRDFKEGFESMKAHYVLTEHKQVNWDALYEKYLPEFKAANKAHDKVANEIAWYKFCAEFHDGHVNFGSDEKTRDAAYSRLSGIDHGLVICTLSDGRTVAAEVDSSLNALGIHNGTEIISWNGMTPAEADELNEMKQLFNFADADNQKFFEGTFAAGTGGDSVEAVIKDDSGNIKTVVLDKISDDYYNRAKEVYDKLLKGMNVGHMTLTKINDTTVCLRIKTMNFDSISEKDKHKKMKDELREQILDAKKEGVRDIIIDIRENNGGSGTMVKAIGELFAPEGEYYYVSDAYFDHDKKCYVKNGEGKWKVAGDVYVDGENILGDDGRIILLVGSHSVSAADHLTKLMSEFENTTVMGFTGPLGSAQGVSPIKLKSGMFSYSSSLMLNKDGTVYIDCGTDYNADDDAEVIVPFDEKAFREIFDEDNDYLMDTAVKYLEEMER